MSFVRVPFPCRLCDDITVAADSIVFSWSCPDFSRAWLLTPDQPLAIERRTGKVDRRRATRTDRRRAGRLAKGLGAAAAPTS